MLLLRAFKQMLGESLLASLFCQVSHLSIPPRCRLLVFLMLWTWRQMNRNSILSVSAGQSFYLRSHLASPSECLHLCLSHGDMLQASEYTFQAGGSRGQDIETD